MARCKCEKGFEGLDGSLTSSLFFQNEQRLSIEVPVLSDGELSHRRQAYLLLDRKNLSRFFFF
jgi:hypothetical protein